VEARGWPYLYAAASARFNFAYQDPPSKRLAWAAGTGRGGRSSIRTSAVPYSRVLISRSALARRQPAVASPFRVACTSQARLKKSR
jgi:hypothetical protein